MAQQVPFHITAGLPFEKTIMATLPTGRDWWTVDSEFEVLGQIREGPNVTANLLLDMSTSMTVVFDGVDLVTITLSLPGSETRKLTQSGHYDVVMSDIFTTDARAIVLLKGPVNWSPLVTAEVPSASIL